MDFKSLQPHLIAIVVFAALSVLFVSPALEGKILFQHDIIQADAGSHYLKEYRANNGDEALWNPNVFSGMPSFQQSIEHPGNLLRFINTIFRKAFPNPAGLIFLMMFGFYILLTGFGLNPWLRLTGAVAFAFASLNIISLDAGHNAKINALAYFPAVLGGVVMAYRGKPWLGAAIAVIFTSLQISTNHFQITYYLIITMGIYAIAELIVAIKDGAIPAFAKTSAILLIAGILAVGPNISRMWTTQVYAGETIRGGKSELSNPNKANQEEKKSKGLDWDYAMRWSYGQLETMTLIIPNFMGGASTGEIDANSALAKNGIPQQYWGQIPLYWGDQPFTAGPTYFGAIVCFLFLLGLLLVKDHHRWWILFTVILVTLLAWGKNFEGFNRLFFDYFPMYNKFRTPTMIFLVASVLFPLMGMLGLQRIWNGEIAKKELQKMLMIAGGIAGWIIILGGFILPTIDSLEYFKGNMDNQLQSSGWPIAALIEDRQSILQGDAFRSLIFIALAVAIIYAWSMDLIKKPLIAVLGLGVLILVDLWGVDKRFLNESDFMTEREYQQQHLAPKQYDLQIMQDPDPHYRVINLTVSTFNDNIPSYHHRNIGGYHAAKLIRYQDLIERQISSNNRYVLDMLNTKYFIVPGQNKSPVVQQNPGALGNAWFVKEIQWAADADAEMAALSTFNPAQTVIIDERFKDGFPITNLNFGAGSKIKLSSFDPKLMTYEASVQGNSPQFAVFSEIYYDDGKNAWHAYVDGEETDIYRVNYTLRGIVVPPGTHTIEFKFIPEAYYAGTRYSFIGSVLVLLFAGGMIYLHWREEGELRTENGE